MSLKQIRTILITNEISNLFRNNASLKFPSDHDALNLTVTLESSTDLIKMTDTSLRKEGSYKNC